MFLLSSFEQTLFQSDCESPSSTSESSKTNHKSKSHCNKTKDFPPKRPLWQISNTVNNTIKFEDFGLHLKKSHGKLSLTVERPKPPPYCSECFKLQRFCSECNMKVILRRHLTGRTSQNQFDKFLIECLTNSSRDFRRTFNKILDEVGEELGFDTTVFQSEEIVIEEESETAASSFKHKGILKSLTLVEEIVVNFCLRVSSFLKNSELYGNMKKIITRNDAAVQAIFNHSIETHNLEDFISETIIFIQRKNSNGLTECKAISKVRKIQAIETNKNNEIVLKKKKNKSLDLMCIIF